MEGKPQKLQGALKAGSPVLSKLFGAGIVAAGVMRQSICLKVFNIARMNVLLIR